MSPEHIIQTQILGYLELLHIFAWRNNTGRRGRVSYGLKGSSDILGCYKGRFLAIEVKAPGGRVSPEQAAFLDRINALGGYGILAESLDDVRSALYQTKKVDK